MKNAFIFLIIASVVFLVGCFVGFADGKFRSNLSLTDLKFKNLQLTEDLAKLQIQVLKNNVEIKHLKKRINELDNVTVTATAYTKSNDETDATPNESACLVNPPIGSIAVSQDLFYKGWTCGKWVKIKHLGIFKIRKILDVMHERKTKQIDIVKHTKREANNFGIKRNLNVVLLTHYDKM